MWFPLLLLFTLTLGTSAAAAAARGLEHDDGDEAAELAACSGGGPSLRGGMRSLIASRPFASSNDVILWVGEKPCSAAFESRQLPVRRARANTEGLTVPQRRFAAGQGAQRQGAGRSEALELEHALALLPGSARDKQSIR